MPECPRMSATKSVIVWDKSVSCRLKQGILLFYQFSETSSSGGDSSVEDYHHRRHRWRILNNRVRSPGSGSGSASSRESGSECSQNLHRRLLSPLSTSTDATAEFTFSTMNSRQQENMQVIGDSNGSLV